MKKKHFVQVIIALIFIVIAGFQFWDKLLKSQKSELTTTLESVAQTFDLETQTNNEGSVMVAVTPKQPVNTATWEFEIVLDTHSVELDEDLVKAVVLIVDGKSYRPIGWFGDPPGGHHRTGVLQFGSIILQPKSTILKFLKIGGIEERNFSW